jgi:chloramphenicol 3-O-phosphotransferase
MNAAEQIRVQAAQLGHSVANLSAVRANQRTGRLIIITGPAAVGKSTLARGLQTHFGRDGQHWLVFELDSFGRGVPREWIAFEKHVGRSAARGFIYGPVASGGLDLTLGIDGRRVLAAFHRAVAATVSSGMDVICEAIVYDDADHRDWLDALGDIEATWVRLDASIDLLEERERADRTRLFQGLARGMSARPKVGTYDVEGDSGVQTVDELVERTLESVVRKQSN